MNIILKNIKELINGIDKKVVNLINIGTNIGFLVCVVGVISLYIEYKRNISIEFYNIGLSIFKLGIIIALGFLVIGGGMGILKKKTENN